MTTAKEGRLWFPMDVTFWEDPSIIAVGEKAAILYQRAIAYAKRHQTDGLIPMAAIRSLGGRRWRPHFEALVNHGLIEVTLEDAPSARHLSAKRPPFVRQTSDVCAAKWARIVAYLAWNESRDEIAERREKNRERKQRSRASSPDVTRDSACDGRSIEEEREKEREAEQSSERARARVPDASASELGSASKSPSGVMKARPLGTSASPRRHGELRPGDTLSRCPECGEAVTVRDGKHGLFATCVRRACDHKIPHLSGRDLADPRMDPLDHLLANWSPR